MPANHTLAAEIDTLLQATYTPHEPGAAVIATKGGEAVFCKGYGLANLEHTIPITPDTVFRLASITKQFTAVAILMLMEQDRLALDDPITRFLPDYPTHDHTITIEHRSPTPPASAATSICPSSRRCGARIARSRN